MRAIGNTSLPAVRTPKAPPRLREEEPVPQPPADNVDLGNPELVDVGHRRELRGAWVATVYAMNFPSNPGSPAQTQKQELTAMLDRLQECRFNAIFFHVRPEGDALYSSDLEPWSNSLTGTQGKDPGYDPLAFLIDEAHKRNIEVHAWLNPYRAEASSKTHVAPHIAVTNPDVVHPYDKYKWMDPAAEPVQKRLVDVCADITKRYDVDGIHFDDYFYPYPANNKDFPDEATWRAYQAGGGKLSRADWRRENVNQAVKSVHEAVEREKDYVRFGISPFGLPAPDRPPGVTGLNQYDELYADTQKWMDEGWVDYLAPQLYWPTTQPRQPYETLLNWWADHASGGRHIFAGNNLADLGKSSKWTVQEYKKEVAISRNRPNSDGNIWWNIAPLMENRQNIVRTFKDELYSEPALTPALSTAGGKTVTPPELKLQDGKVELHNTDSAPLRAWTVYRQDGDRWKLDRIVPGEENHLQLPAGKWAIAAASMHGVESKGVVVDVPAAT